MKTSARNPIKRVTTSHFTESKGKLHRFQNKFRLKTIKIPGEAASADGEAAVTLPAELRLIRVWYHPRFQATAVGLGMYPSCVSEDCLYIYIFSII